MDNNAILAMLVPVLVGILEAIKKAGFPVKFIPALSIVLGIGLGIVYSGFDVRMGILYGVAIGLSAVGLYSGVTNVVEGVKQLTSQ